MKKLFQKCTATLMVALSFFAAMVASLFEPQVTALRRGVPNGFRLKQGGFVLLGARGYQGYLPGTIVELTASTEAALITNNQAQTSSGPPTAGNVTTTALSGCCAIGIGASSVTITNPAIQVQTQVYAVVAQAAADATCLRVERVVCAAGSVTIYGTANATAVTSIDWAILNPNGSFSNPQ